MPTGKAYRERLTFRGKANYNYRHEKIGKFLKEKRKEKEYSLRDLEKKAGLTNPYIRNVEEGIRKPTFEVLMKLLDGLNIETSEFLMETGHMKPIKQWTINQSYSCFLKSVNPDGGIGYGGRYKHSDLSNTMFAWRQYVTQVFEK